MTASAIRREKDDGSEFRPPLPITVAPWHNYDPNHTTNEEWQDKHKYNTLNYYNQQSSGLAQKEMRPTPEQVADWHNYNH